MKKLMDAACAHLAQPGWTGDMVRDARAAIEHVNTVADALLLELAQTRRDRDVALARLERVLEAADALSATRQPPACSCPPTGSAFALMEGGLCIKCKGAVP